MKKLIRVGAMAASAWLCVPAAQAIPVQWTLTDVSLSDGGVATGSFVYEADTNAFSRIEVVTTAGAVGAAASFAAACTAPACPHPSTGDEVVLVNPPSTGDLTNITVLFMLLQTRLTNAGGTIGVAMGGSSTCIDSACISLPPDARTVVGGTLVGTPYIPPAPQATAVPALGPRGLVLLSLALGCALVWSLRRLR